MTSSIYSELAFFHVGAVWLKTVRRPVEAIVEFSSVRLPEEVVNIKLKYLSVAEIYPFKNLIECNMLNTTKSLSKAQ